MLSTTKFIHLLTNWTDRFSESYFFRIIVQQTHKVIHARVRQWFTKSRSYEARQKQSGQELQTVFL